MRIQNCLLSTIVGWESFDEKQFQTRIINIVDKEYPARVKKRLDIMNGITSESKVGVINLESHEKSFKVRLMDLIYLCDWITYYTAVLRGYDPSEIRNIDLLKEKLA